MDKIYPEHELIAGALEAVHRHGLQARLVAAEPALGRTRADALIEVQHGDQRILYAAEVRRAVTPATLGPIVHHLKRLGEQALLITDYVTPPVADKLREQRVAFLDAAGNAYLDRPPLLVWVKGQKAAAKPVAPELGRAFQPGGLQVVFVLLCDPQVVNRPYRELAKMAGVAHGTVGWVMADLQQLGHIHDIKGKRGTRRLFYKRRLLAQWAEAYARTLRPRTLIGRYYVPTIDGWKDWPVAEHGAMWGGEPAAALMTRYLRPGELTIYADKLPGMLAARQKFVKHPGPGQTAIVDVRKRFWNLPADPAHPDLAPAALVYGDLLGTGDARCIETAHLVYDGHLARFLDDV